MGVQASIPQQRALPPDNDVCHNVTVLDATRNTLRDQLQDSREAHNLLFVGLLVEWLRINGIERVYVSDLMGIMNGSSGWPQDLARLGADDLVMYPLKGTDGDMGQRNSKWKSEMNDAFGRMMLSLQLWNAQERSIQADIDGLFDRMVTCATRVAAELQTARERVEAMATETVKLRKDLQTATNQSKMDQTTLGNVHAIVEDYGKYIENQRTIIREEYEQQLRRCQKERSDFEQKWKQCERDRGAMRHAGVYQTAAQAALRDTSRLIHRGYNAMWWYIQTACELMTAKPVHQDGEPGAKRQCIDMKICDQTLLKIQGILFNPDEREEYSNGASGKNEEDLCLLMDTANKFDAYIKIQSMRLIIQEQAKSACDTRYRAILGLMDDIEAWARRLCARERSTR